MPLPTFSVFLECYRYAKLANPPQVPIYFSTGLTERANNYYKMFITWTNEKIRKTFVERNMFDFKHIKGFDRR